MSKRPLWITALGILGILLLLIGSSMGLFLAPAERHMGDVSRILSVHVPIAWNFLLIYTFGFVFAVLSLWTGKPKWDPRMVAALEVGVVFNVLLLLTGMLFAKPTWGVWWDWEDVRLVTSLLSVFLFGGVLSLRSFVDDDNRRTVWSAVATIIAWVDVPLIYFCVRWWRSLHQEQSSPETIDPSLYWPFRINAIGVLLLAIWLISLRSEIERRRAAAERTAPPPRLDSSAPASA